MALPLRNVMSQLNIGKVWSLLASDMASTSSLLAAGFSSAFNTTILTYEDYQEKLRQDPSSAEDSQALNIEQLLRFSQMCGTVGDRVQAADKVMKVHVKMLTGKTMEIEVSVDATVQHLKGAIEDKEHFPVEQQRLVSSSSTPLENDKPLGHYGIHSESTVMLVITSKGGASPLYYIDTSLLDPSFNYDFTGKRDDGTKLMRGGYRFYRPYGWMKIALKVLNRYSDNVWLGPNGLRTDDAPGEWPVSYHGSGTDAEEEETIAHHGSRQSKGKGHTYERGIYMAPDISVAAKYASTFEHCGRKYRMVLQNRVNPQGLKMIGGGAEGVHGSSELSSY